MRWVKAALAPVVAVGSAIVAFFGLEVADQLLDNRLIGMHGETPWATSAYALTLLAVPLGVGALVAWTLRRWWPWRPWVGLPTRWKRAVCGALALAYVLTAFVGGPMVQSDLTDMVMDEFRSEVQIDESGVLPYHRVMKGNPWCRTFVSAPVVPGLVVAYHEYQASGLNGRGAFYVVVWYGAGPRYVTSLQTWVS